MIAVDTNLLVRILADDPGQPAQVDAARALASQSQQVFVPPGRMVDMQQRLWTARRELFRLFATDKRQRDGFEETRRRQRVTNPGN